MVIGRESKVSLLGKVNLEFRMNSGSLSGSCAAGKTSEAFSSFSPGTLMGVYLVKDV